MENQGEMWLLTSHFYHQEEKEHSLSRTQVSSLEKPFPSFEYSAVRWRKGLHPVTEQLDYLCSLKYLLCLSLRLWTVLPVHDKLAMQVSLKKTRLKSKFLLMNWHFPLINTKSLASQKSYQSQIFQDQQLHHVSVSILLMLVLLPT